MNWEDEGFLIKKNKYSENANIINVFTSNHGKVSGIVYGGNSRKIKNFLQIGNKIHIVYNAKNPNKIGYFKTELITPISARFFNDKKRSSGIISVTSILNSLLPELQINKEVFDKTNFLLSNFENDNWIILFIFWEYHLIQHLGFGLDLESLNKDKIKINDNEFSKIRIDGIFYNIPNFLISNNVPSNIDLKLIKNSLIFNKTLFLNKFFRPNNMIFPRSRNSLENYFN